MSVDMDNLESNHELPLHQEPGQTGVGRGQSPAQKRRSALPRSGWPGD